MNLIQQLIPPQLAILIRHRIMQRMRSYIPPKPIQAHSCTRRFRACDLKHPRSNPQAGIRCNDLDARNPFRQLPSLSRSQLPAGVQIASVFVHDSIDFLTCAVC